ncbi:uncharacterized protein P884DRAFT_228184 [Thermothelomyces heterothallicus CBS 202.75]|uniref:uncharacterized protein n=1 Tax=Thermothelomyces heterothallicus CBS 202.75 TaxID=1149848 RepID=UPI00374365EA
MAAECVCRNLPCAPTTLARPRRGPERQLAYGPTFFFSLPLFSAFLFSFSFAFFPLTVGSSSQEDP